MLTGSGWQRANSKQALRTFRNVLERSLLIAGDRVIAYHFSSWQHTVLVGLSDEPISSWQPRIGVPIVRPMYEIVPTKKRGPEEQWFSSGLMIPGRFALCMQHRSILGNLPTTHQRAAD